MDKKRLFFALDVVAPWPKELPRGRCLAENQRHMTLAFLGEADWENLLQNIANMPQLPFKVGLTGHFDKCLLLPIRYPHVAAWHVTWKDDSKALIDYQKRLTNWLVSIGLPIKDSGREWLPHVTICREPMDANGWKRNFHPLPMATRDLCLYESLGGLNYRPIWSKSTLPPFEEFEHTADIAFIIYGESLKQILLHAQIALAFKFPPLLDMLLENKDVQSLEDIIIDLNDLICRADSAIGCPFKAVSFHGEVEEVEPNIFKWEMIVDV
jgi:2'-5' RNA ligase